MELDEREACGMHDGDKLKQAATGNIICYKNNILANPFPSGVDLMNLAMKIVTHFSYGKLINNTNNNCELTYCTKIKPKVDKNGTHVVAHHRLL